MAQWGVATRGRWRVRHVLSLRAFACRQLVQLTEKVWKAWLFLQIPNFIIPSCFWKRLFPSASLRDGCVKYIHTISHDTLAGASQTGSCLDSRLQRKGCFGISTVISSIASIFLMMPSQLHLLLSPYTPPPHPPPHNPCRPFSLLFYFCSQKAAAGCQSGRMVLRRFCGHAGK